MLQLDLENILFALCTVKIIFNMFWQEERGMIRIKSECRVPEVSVCLSDAMFYFTNEMRDPWAPNRVGLEKLKASAQRSAVFVFPESKQDVTHENLLENRSRREGCGEAQPPAELWAADL